MRKTAAGPLGARPVGRFCLGLALAGACLAGVAAPPPALAARAATSDQISPLLVTEVQTDQPGGKRFTYVEVYNNSTERINFKDYTFYYGYPNGGGKVFGADPSLGSYQYASGDKDLFIEPGKTLVLWMSEGTAGRTLADFNAFYGTDLVENEDIVRLNYSGIHNSEPREYAFGKREDAIMVSAWSNETKDEIPVGNPEKLAIQYAYSGSGRVCTGAGVSKATPGEVGEAQVPGESGRAQMKDAQATVDNVAAQQLQDGGLSIGADIPYEGSSASVFASAHYRQVFGEDATQWSVLPMRTCSNGRGFTATIPAEELFSDTLEYYVSAYGGAGTVVESPHGTASVAPKEPDATHAAPFYVTEAKASAPAEDGGQYTYFEVYNASDTAINASFFNILYYYDYPDQTAKQSGKVWNAKDFTANIEPGATMVFWLTSNGTAIDQFNAYYGTDLELGRDIVQIDYAGLHGTDPRWIRFGTSEEDAFTLAGFNTEKWQITGRGTALQFAAPHGTDPVNRSIPVEVSEPTPGSVEYWQKTSTTARFAGYKDYPADDGKAPKLEVCPDEQLPVPASINEGDTLKVMYETDLLKGATGDDRLDAMGGTQPNKPGGNPELATRPYLMGTELLYKLDDASEWTVVQQRTQWRLGHFLMQIPSDVLFGHDSVTFKVRAHTLYGMSETAPATVKINRLNDVDGIRLNVADGKALSGMSTITANDGSDNAGTVITVDGKKQDTRKMLEDGAWVMVETQGMDSYFKNAVTAPYADQPRDVLTIMGTWCEAPLSRAIHVDNKYFTLNPETETFDATLTFWAGTSGTPFEEIYEVVENENHEDYKVTGLEMALANGESVLPSAIAPDNEKTNTSTALDAVHAIGDSAGMVPHMDATFKVPVERATAVGVTLDTTKLSDGEHTVAAVSGEKSRTATIVVDNTAPAITWDVAQGAMVYAPFELSADTLASDEGGVADVVAALDGQPLELPRTIVPRDLTRGEHVLRVAATDEAGNVTTAEFTFITDVVDPDAEQVEGAPGSATSALLELDIKNGPVAVEFREGATASLENGRVREVPELSSDSKADGTYPAKVYEVTVGDDADAAIRFSWKGAAGSQDENHPLQLFALNYAAGTWDSASTVREDGSAEMTFPAAEHVRDGKALVYVGQVVTGGTPQVKVPGVRMVSETPALSSWDGTGRPEDYDFAFAWQTDTQYYTESFPSLYDSMNRWIVDNADEWRMRYVIHTGDIVDDGDMLGEWENASRSMKILDDAGMPYGVLGGNHDVFAGMENYTNYWKYFGEDRFSGRPTYGGSYKNNLGHYDLLTENGQDFLILYMSWDIYTDEIDWMNEVLQKYPDRKAIICLHRYANVKPDADGQLLDYTGKLLRDQVVSRNPNVFAVLNGHYHGASLQTDQFDDSGDGTPDRIVYQICTDYQSEPDGGGEYLKMLYFDLKGNKVYVNSYSPSRNDFNYYDAPKQKGYGPGTKLVAQDIVEMDVAFDTSEKTLSASDARAEILGSKVIGTLDGSQGKVSFEWKGLAPQTTYEWYAHLTNAQGGVTDTRVASVTTTAAPAAKTYTITAVAGEGGTISNQGATRVLEGADLEYTVRANAGYRIDRVVVDGSEVQLKDGTFVFEDVRSDHTIEAFFSPMTAPEQPQRPGGQQYPGGQQQADRPGKPGSDETLAQTGDPMGAPALTALAVLGAGSFMAGLIGKRRIDG